MTKTIEKFYCDICGVEGDVDIELIKYPVIFHTDQTEGRCCEPYISYENIDVCDKCRKQILKLSAVGAQGYNKYSIIEAGVDFDR